MLASNMMKLKSHESHIFNYSWGTPTLPGSSLLFIVMPPGACAQELLAPYITSPIVPSTLVPSQF